MPMRKAEMLAMLTDSELVDELVRRREEHPEKWQEWDALLTRYGYALIKTIDV